MVKKEKRPDILLARLPFVCVEILLYNNDYVKRYKS